MENSLHSHVEGETRHVKSTNPVIVFLILAVFTIIEVGITVIAGLPRATTVPLLLSISFVKASLVALYFMHLRYEKAVYGLVFIAPAAFAVLLISVLLLS